MGKSAGPIKIKVDVRSLFNGKILPGFTSSDPGVLGYDMVVRQGCSDLVKIPFTKMSNNFDLALFGPNDAILPKMFKFSNRYNVARYDDDREVLNVFIYKIRRDKKTNVVGYERRIGKKSDPQDVPVYIIHPRYPAQATAHVAFEATALASKGVYKPMEFVKLYKSVPSSPIWYTQASFYGSCHFSGNNGIQMLDLDAILRDYYLNANKTPKTILEMLIDFAEIVSEDLRITYRNDFDFSSPKIQNDYGDSQLELTRFGDCEDFAHFYMRIFRLMMWVYGLNYSPSEKLFKMWEKFAENYVPMVHICKVEISHEGYKHKEYHSTMLMIPMDESMPVISFEVTNPKKSAELSTTAAIEEFNQWHLENYFLVDNYFIARIEGPVHKLTVENLIPKVRNY